MPSPTVSPSSQSLSDIFPAHLELDKVREEYDALGKKLLQLSESKRIKLAGQLCRELQKTASAFNHLVWVYQDPEFSV